MEGPREGVGRTAAGDPEGVEMAADRKSGVAYGVGAGLNRVDRRV